MTDSSEPTIPPTQEEAQHSGKKPKKVNWLLYAGIAIVVFAVAGAAAFAILSPTVLTEYKTVATVDGTAISAEDFQAQYRYIYVSNLVTLGGVDSYISQLQQLIQAYGTDATMANQVAYFQQELQSYQQQQTQLQGGLTDGVAIAQATLKRMEEDVIIKAQAAKLGISVSQADLDKFYSDSFGYFPGGTPTVAPTATEMATPTFSATQQAMLVQPPTQAPTSTQEVVVTETGTVVAGTPATTETSATEAATSTPTDIPEQPTATLSSSPTPEQTATPYTQAAFQKDQSDYFTNMQTKYSILRSDMDRFFMASLLRQKVALEVTKSVSATKTEVWGRHILVADQKTAQEVLDQLKAGANWYDLAAKYSTDTSTKDNGGDLGWVYKGETVQTFEDALFALKPGETSGIVQSSFGFHIIQSLGTREVPLTANELSSAQQTAFNAWLTDSLSKVTIKENNWKAYLPADVLKLYTQFKSGATTQQ